jgi:hypothetical protein
MIAYGVASYNKQPDISAGPLGRGVTVASLTVQLDVPNRDDPNSILNKLHALSLSADTSTRKGVQDLLSAVAIELLRQQKSIGSAHTVSTNYPVQGQAEREFHLLSVKGRSKVDRLAGKASLLRLEPLPESSLILGFTLHSEQIWFGESTRRPSPQGGGSQ